MRWPIQLLIGMSNAAAVPLEGTSLLDGLIHSGSFQHLGQESETFHPTAITVQNFIERTTGADRGACSLFACVVFCLGCSLAFPHAENVFVSFINLPVRLTLVSHTSTA